MKDQVVKISDRNVLVTTEEEHTLTEEEIQYINEMISDEKERIDNDSKNHFVGINKMDC